MAQFLKKLFSKDTTDYFRLTNKSVDEICNKKTIKISDEMLKKAFNIKDTEIKKNRPKWIIAFHKKCEKLVLLFHDSKYVSDIHSTIFDIIPKEITDKNKSSEILMNIVAYCISMGLSWSSYILAFPSGQKIFKDVFEKTTRAKALVNIFALLMTIYITSGYDDKIFRENFFSFLPTINKVAQDQAWYQAYMVKVQSLMLSQITTKAFLAFFQNFVFKETKEEKEEEKE